VCALALLAQVACAQEQAARLVVEREGRTLLVEPYGAGIVRITLSRDKASALAGAGYGITAASLPAGWSQERDADGTQTLRSGQMMVRIPAESATGAKGLPLDELNLKLRRTYFYDTGNRNHPFHDLIAVQTAEGKPLLTMRGWQMAPNQGGEASRVSATFDAPAEEHYYGLGQQQQGVLDLRDHQIKCWHDYDAVGGENVCVPFMVSSRNYGVVWDNPSRTTVNVGFNLQTVWSSEIGDRVSFFVIAGANSDQIYSGYRQLTGVTHLLPKGAYGYIQSKAIYPTQEQALAVAKGYRDRKLPLDMLVVDFLNMTRQGEMDLDPARWPDPAAMNQQLHAMGVKTMLSVWPHYSEGTQFYETLLAKHWLITRKDGTPDRGHYTKEVGPNIDTTNPEAAWWWWEKIRDRYVKPYGFDSIWLDETEPDVDPANDVFSIGSGLRYYNVYPLFHTASVYEGFRRDFGDSKRVLILARASYLGAQRNGTVFWSSDIVANWDMLRRSVPAGLNFAASGQTYWDTDIAGFFSPQLPAGYHAGHKPLIDASDALENIGTYEDYPELFVRWFEWGAFLPVMRTHGERMHNEVWSYGKQAGTILEKYLRLRYELMPYTYSAAYGTYQTGAPFLRALFMDFGNDPQVADIRDEYMYGPAFLVAPVTEQGAVSRRVYLPAGTAWYDFWTNQKYEGGQTIVAAAPIDRMPLFVRAGAIVPMGSTVLSADQSQRIARVRVYPGADGAFMLFNDDGTTYAYEKGAGSVTKLRWSDGKQQFTHEGAAAWNGPDAQVVEVVRP
jgi:alpha-glucosidase/alpha-D-xyloside xylohydrolase